MGNLGGMTTLRHATLGALKAAESESIKMLQTRGLERLANGMPPITNACTNTLPLGQKINFATTSARQIPEPSL